MVQESFVRLCRNWDRTAQPGAYLRTVVVSRCRSWQRRRILERQPQPRPPTPSVDGEARELLDALARLGARQRAALVLRFYADLSERRWPRPSGVDRGQSSRWCTEACGTWKG